MKPITEIDSLGLVETGKGRDYAFRSLLLLESGFPSLAISDLAQLPIGHRDYLLMKLRASAFGASATGFAYCPYCKSEEEFTFDTSIVTKPEMTNESMFDIEHDRYRIRFRLPNTRDVALSGNEKELLDRIIVSATDNDCRIDASGIPDELVGMINAKISQIDPLSHIMLNLVCSSCKQSWDLVFDVVIYYWAEIERLAKNLMSDIHVLASAYHWSPKDILSLPAGRRKVFIEMVMG
jgi:hypothetical protein